MKKIILIALRCGFLIPLYLIQLLFAGLLSKIKPGYYNYKLIRKMACSTIKHCGKTIHVYGLDNLRFINKYDSSFVIYSNHRSIIDPVLIASFIERDMSFVMKKGLKRNMLLSIINKITASKFFGRTPKEDIESIKQMCDESNKNWLIFPEGKRIINDEDFVGGPGKIKFHASTFRIPVNNESIIFPIAIYNTESIVGCNFGEDVYISFLEPIFHSSYKEMKPVQISRMVEEIVSKEVEMLSNV